jgi:major type 1 subunit fimbrin (pilin)
VPGKTPFTLKLTGCKASTTAFGVLAYFPSNQYSSGNWKTGNGSFVIFNIKIGATETADQLGKPATDASYKYTSGPPMQHPRHCICRTVKYI